MPNHISSALKSKTCACCGKGPRKVTTLVLNPHLSGDGAHWTSPFPLRDSWGYEGNQIVVKKSYFYTGNGMRWLHSVSVWDGETTVLEKDPFCSTACANRFAVAAHDNGFRMLSSANRCHGRIQNESLA